MTEAPRCAWVGKRSPLRRLPRRGVGGQRRTTIVYLFEMLLLEGAQAGLSWRLILGKRESYRRAYDGFDPLRIAAWDEAKLEQLAQDPGIVRNRLKIRAARTNAAAALALIGALRRACALLLALRGRGTPIVNRWKSIDEVPASTPLSDRLSKELKRLGFKFVGSTICYSFMQAVGMVDDHTRDCFRCRPVSGSPLNEAHSVSSENNPWWTTTRQVSAGHQAELHRLDGLNTPQDTRHNIAPVSDRGPDFRGDPSC